MPKTKQQKTGATLVNEGVLSKPASKAPVPDGPPSKEKFFQTEPGIADDESYGDDEKALNTFLRLHPMLSTEASSVKTLSSVAKLFTKSTISVGDLPVVPKSHDDLFLRPPNTLIGERPCINDDRCIAKFLAQIRFGPESEKAFVCTEFLLPDAHRKFLDGRGLPPRRSKCLLCYRYFVSYLYTAARADPSFRTLQETGIGTQLFANSICPPVDAVSKEQIQQIEEDIGDAPVHCSSMNDDDGYAAHAALFVDEDFSKHRASREDKLAALNFRPAVRFDSSHYRYVMSKEGPHIEQVGIGARDSLSEFGLHFREPVASQSGPLPAKTSKSL